MNNTWKRTTRRYAPIVVTTLLGVGYLHEWNGTLSNNLSGFVSLFGVLLVIFQIVGALLTGMMAFTVSTSKSFIMEQPSRWEADGIRRFDAIEYIRKLEEGLDSYKLSLFTVLDVLADGFFFVTLVLSNHMVLAGLFLTAVSLIHTFVGGSKGGVEEIKEYLEEEIKAERQSSVMENTTR